MESKVTQLKRAYTKKFKQLNKNILNANDSGLLLFVEHLKYLRDNHTITSTSIEANHYLLSINAAIKEFEEWQKNKKEFHWNNFCEFVKLNMKEWLIPNDSI